uniref:Uncharacterized protein n=1 Tax=Anopheles christyi TaxID=43041 RepID=A0A182KDU2_9DIPT
MSNHSVRQLAFLAALSLLLPSVRAQTGTVYPATEFTYGSYTSALTICYSNTINSQSIRLTPITRTFSFTPTTLQNTVRYIQIMSPDLKKFYAQIGNGGIGTVNPVSTDIVVTSVHGGFLNVAVRIYCVKANLFSLLPITRIITFTPNMYVRYIKIASRTQQLLAARIVQGSVNMTSVRPISIALTSDYGGRLNAEILAFFASNRNSILPDVRVVSFTPVATQMNVRYIEIVSFAHHPIVAQIAGGGIGTGNPTPTSIVISAQLGGSFRATVKFFCGP